MMDAQDLNQGNVVTNDIPNLGNLGGNNGGGNNNNGGGGGGSGGNGGGGRKNFNNNRNFGGGNNQVSDDIFIIFTKTRFNHLTTISDILQNSKILLKISNS